MAPSTRGWLGYAADRLFTWHNSLPPMTCSYTMESMRIPIGNDLELAANLYQTLASPPSGTLLVRTPYGIDFAPSLGLARYFAARGYHVLLNACRGTSGSDGERDPGTYEVTDGLAVVQWMRNQPWYTGSFGTLGGSYLGTTQWALLKDPPKDMRAAAIFTGTHDMYDFQWGTGAMYSHMITWADVTNRMENSSFISLVLFMRSVPGRYRELLSSVPLLDAVDGYFTGKTPSWLRTTIQTPDRSAPFWQSVDITASLDQASIPILLVSGWYDVILDSVIEQYEKLAGRGLTPRLVIGPWTHLQAQGRNIPAETLPFMDEHLAGQSNSAKPAPVRIFVTGREQWMDLPSWPPVTAKRDLYLTNDEQLAWEGPTTHDASSTFTFDPTDPTPDTGAPLGFTIGVGTTDQNTALVARTDVLSWTSAMLDADLELFGKPSVTIHHSTDIPHADILLVLSEVDQSGVSRYKAEKYLRLDAEKGTGPLQLSLSTIAHRFKRGNRIRLSVAGGSHPRWVRNLGSGENPGTGTTLRAVKHTVQHHAGAKSRVCLPVLA